MKERLGDLTVLLLQTDKGPLHTKTPFSEIEKGYLTLATPDEVARYYRNLALVVLERKKATCEGLAATTWHLAKMFSEHVHYRQIDVQICQLDNWGHLLVRFKHANASDALFYDPWYQRCFSGDASVPVLIEEACFADEIKKMVGQASWPPDRLVLHMSYFYQCDISRERVMVDAHPKKNWAYDSSYSILCGTT